MNIYNSCTSTTHANTMVGRPQDWGLYLLGYMCETIYAANAERVRCEDPKTLNDLKDFKDLKGSMNLKGIKVLEGAWHRRGDLWGLAGWCGMGKIRGAPAGRLTRRGSRIGGGYLLSHFRSTIGAAGFNFSVRNGKRWNPRAMAALVRLSVIFDCVS